MLRTASSEAIRFLRELLTLNFSLKLDDTKKPSIQPIYMPNNT